MSQYSQCTSQLTREMDEPKLLGLSYQERSMSLAFRDPSAEDTDPFENDASRYYDPSVEDQVCCSYTTDKEDTSNRSRIGTLQGSSGDNSAMPYMDCGEPLKAQRLVMDFTPVKGEDDDQTLMKKCSDFWELLAKYPNLEKLKAAPGPYYTLSGDSRPLEAESKESYDSPPPTAFHWVAKDDIMNCALATDMKKHYCEQNGDGNSETQREKRRNEKPRRRGSKCTKSRVTRGMWESEQLGKEMDAWDQIHHTPKSLGA